MVNCAFFKDIQKQRELANAALLKTLRSTIIDAESKQSLLQAIDVSCKIYQTDGFFRGVNETLKMLNKDNEINIEICDILKKRRIT